MRTPWKRARQARTFNLIKGWVCVIWRCSEEKGQAKTLFGPTLIAEAERRAYSIAEKYYANFHRGKMPTPDAIAGACLWLACQELNIRIPQLFFANLAGRVEVTIRKAKSHIKKVLNLQ